MKPGSTLSLQAALTAFFHEHLRAIRGASHNTIRSYSDAIRLFLTHLAARRRRPVATLRLEDLDVDAVIGFLSHLQAERRNACRSRNCRHAALRSFFKYLAGRDILNAERYRRILSLPSQRTTSRPAVYLEPELVKAIIAQPDRATASGVRDYALLLLLYNTGARVSEALGSRMDDIELTRPPTIRLRGKGKRERLCPLWPQTVDALRRLEELKRSDDDGHLFRNARGGPLSRDGAAYILGKHALSAATTHPDLRRIHVTPHVFRHSCAVALLQAGVDLTVIRDYLGHASVATTNHYVSTNLDMRRRALDTFWKRSELVGARSRSWQPTAAVLEFLRSL